MKTEPTEALEWVRRRKATHNHTSTVLLAEAETGCGIAFSEGQSSPKIIPFNRDKAAQYLDNKFWEYKVYECMPENDNGYEYVPLEACEKIIDGLVPMIKQSMKQSSPKIKQLEWVEVWEGYEDARTQFGHYVVKPSIDNKTFLMIDLRKGIQPYLTLNEAKAAARADFEKRVKECLG